MNTKMLILLLTFSFLVSGCSPKRSLSAKPSPSPEVITTPQVENDTFISPMVKGYFQFKVKLTNGWVIKRYDEENGFFVEFAKGDYTLDIFKPYEGSVCVFPHQKQYEGPSESFEGFTDLKTNFGNIRLGNHSDYGTGAAAFIACNKDASFNENGEKYMSTGTKIGEIRYYLPESPDKKLIDDMNTFVQSFEVVK